MKKSWNLIPKILSGEKTIESRWYQSKRAPWSRVKKDDTVFFKNAGEMVTAKARVSRVLQFEIEDLQILNTIVHKYAKDICLINTNPSTWKTLPKYCVLIFLKNPQNITPFLIHKKGFGISSAWLTLPHINQLKVK